MSLQQIWHGTCYWLIRYCVIPLREHSVNQEWSPYVFHFTKATGEVVEFSRTAVQVMVDPYFIGVAMKLKDTAFWGWGFASFTFVGGILAVTWYLGDKGKKQRSDEILGGRDLVDDVDVVNKKLKKKVSILRLIYLDCIFQNIQKCKTTLYTVLWVQGKVPQ